jgi:hypothetical protein
MCDRSTFNCKDPHVTYGASLPAEPEVQATSAMVKDPMTSYATNAMKKEMEEEAKKRSTVHATSPPDVAAQAPPTVGLTEAEKTIEDAARKAKQHSGGLKIFSGNGNMALALEIGRHLGINLGKATVGRFADGEANIMIHENVRGKDCYIIQPTCPPVNDNIMELLLLVSTLSRASARRITVVIPYYGYARQDRKMQVSFVLSSSRESCLSSNENELTLMSCF